MNKKLKRLLASLVLTITLSSNNFVFADPLSDKIELYNKSIENDKERLDQVRQKKEEIEIEIEQLDADIEKIMREIQQNEDDEIKINENIKSAEEEIEKLNKDIEVNVELLKKRIRVIYVDGMSSYIELLIASESIGDLLSRIEFISSINEFHREISAEINDKKEAVKMRKKEMEEEHSILEEIILDNEEKLSMLNEKRDEQDKLLNEIKQYEDLAVSRIDAVEQYVNELKELLKNNTANSEGIVGQNIQRISRGQVDFTVDELIAYAGGFIGTPYLWGGTSPETGFDCSGFVQYVYGHFGIKLNRVTYDQIYDGPHVEKQDLKPGDLVFFGTWEDPHHVGIYLGDNKYMHAPRTGDFIKIDPMTRKDFVIGVRVL